MCCISGLYLFFTYIFDDNAILTKHTYFNIQTYNIAQNYQVTNTIIHQLYSLQISRLHQGDPQLWARLLLSHTYGAWFACLPAFVQGCKHKSAALRTAHDALKTLKDKNCFPLPDETYFRMILHLCSVYNKPALAVRVFQFVQNSGIQLSAITYGIYNKAVLEGTWPDSNRDG